MIDVKLEEVEKRYGPTIVIAGISLDVYRGEFLTLLGPSSCTHYERQYGNYYRYPRIRHGK